MTPDVNAARYLAGDLSGIQRFVLRVKTAGKAQAKRLRARSFLLELLEHAALRIIQERFRVTEDDVLIRGGGGFLVRVPADTDPAHLEQLDIELQRMLWREFGGEIQLALGWADSPLAARAQLERRKRQPGRAVLQRQGRWDLERWSQPPSMILVRCAVNTPQPESSTTKMTTTTVSATVRVVSKRVASGHS